MLHGSCGGSISRFEIVGSGDRTSVVAAHCQWQPIQWQPIASDIDKNQDDAVYTVSTE